MHLVTLVIVLVFGGLTLILNDPLFIKWKSAIVNWLFVIVFLGGQLGAPCVERMLSTEVDLPSAVWRRLNLTWIAVFIIIPAFYITRHMPDEAEAAEKAAEESKDPSESGGKSDRPSH